MAAEEISVRTIGNKLGSIVQIYVFNISRFPHFGFEYSTSFINLQLFTMTFVLTEAKRYSI